MDTICPVIFLLPTLLTSHMVYLFIFFFPLFPADWMDTICPVIFYYLCYTVHRVSTYFFSLSFNSCCSGWMLYDQSFSISSATRIAVCLLIYFPFPWFPAVLDGPYMSSHFLFPLLLGSHCVYFFFPLSLTSCSSDWTIHIQSFSIPLLLGSQSAYLFISPFLSFLQSGWTLYIHSFSISCVTWITVGLLIYFPFL